MNLKKLRDEICGEIELTKGQEKMLFEIFETFQQSNKSEESQINENKQVLTNDFLLELIKGMKTEIEALKKQVEAIDKIKIIDNSIEPKQERFYYENIGGTNYQILDSKLKCCFDNYYSKHASIEICKAMNSLEASK